MQPVERNANRALGAKHWNGVTEKHWDGITTKHRASVTAECQGGITEKCPNGVAKKGGVLWQLLSQWVSASGELGGALNAQASSIYESSGRLGEKVRWGSSVLDITLLPAEQVATQPFE